MKYLLKLVTITVIALSCLSAKALPKPTAFTDEQAIRAIVGEAANQGYNGMLAVACAIRNRHTLQGVYGVNNKVVKSQPKWVWAKAKQAWEESASKDITGGATHWENIGAFGRPKWTAGMIETISIKDHRFYREKG